MNRFILNADDFGMSKEFNNAILEGFRIGLLRSASLTANGLAFDDAVDRVIPQCQGLSVGIHLNIIEGQSMSKGHNFNDSYVDLIYKSFNKKFLEETETEFRAQIEKVLKVCPDVSHIDSHVHTHAIPAIFELTCKLAKEYNIPFVRTQAETPYIVPDWKTTMNRKFAVNILKNILLNTFTLINKPVVKKYNLKTNDYQIGVLYTLMMSDKTLFYGLESIKSQEKLIEALIHPCKYSDDRKNNRTVEFDITQNTDLITKIQKSGIEITDFNLR